MPIFELDASVEVFGVLPDHHDVNVLISRLNAGVGLAGTQAGVEGELLSQGDIDATESRPDGSGHRPFKRDLVLFYGVEHLFRKRRAIRIERGFPDLANIPLYSHAGRCQRSGRGLGYLRPNAVSGE